jgi:hypothetical protein
MSEPEPLITPEQIETLDKLFGDSKMPIETDEDYRKLGEMFGEDQ